MPIPLEPDPQNITSDYNNILLPYVTDSKINILNNMFGRTLVRVHLIPYTPNVSDVSDVKQRRNKHVSHLPQYKRMSKVSLEKFSENICSICHEGFCMNEYYRTLPLCNHSFHKKCVDKWLKNDISMRCPLCRKSHTPDKISG